MFNPTEYSITQPVTINRNHDACRRRRQAAVRRRRADDDSA